MEKITQAELKRLFYYDDNTGIFTRRISLSKRYKAGSVAGTIDVGYVRICIDGIKYRAHRLAWLYMEGYFPEQDIDHIDRNKSNNSWNNLRITSERCNSINCDMRKSNTTGVTGVSFDKSRNKYLATIRSDEGKSVNLGRYHSIVDAARARRHAEFLYGYAECLYVSSAHIFLSNLSQQTSLPVL